MQVAHVHFGERCRLACKLPDLLDRLEVVDRFQVILERFSSDGDALLNDHRRLDGDERIALDRVRCVGEFEVLGVIEIWRPAGRADAKTGRVQPSWWQWRRTGFPLAISRGNCLN